MGAYPDLNLIHNLTQKFLGSGFKSLTKDEGIDLINHLRERVADLERQSHDLKDFSIDRSHEEDVEHNLRPPFAQAITLPVLIDGEDVGIALYIVESAFSQRLATLSVRNSLLKIAKGIRF